MEPIGGIIFLKVDGVQYKAKGEFTYNPGIPKRDPVMGQDGMHGYTEKPQAAFIKGSITKSKNVDLNAFLSFKDATVTLELNGGKTFVLSSAFNGSTGDVKTSENEMDIEIYGDKGEEI